MRDSRRGEQYASCVQWNECYKAIRVPRCSESHGGCAMLRLEDQIIAA